VDEIMALERVLWLTSGASPNGQSMAGKIEYVPIHDPDTDEELHLKMKLEEIEKKWRAEAQPYIDRLAAIHMLKPFKGYFRVNPSMEKGYR